MAAVVWSSWINFLIVLQIRYIRLGYAIDCYVCTSVNKSDPYCEDTFNTSYPLVHYLQAGCNGYRKERQGYFPADHCIKVSGTSTKDSNYTIMIRTCALDSGTLTADTEIVRMSHCGHFVFDKTYFSGCVQACQRDGCNGATSTSLPGAFFSVTFFVSLFFLANTSSGAFACIR